MTTITELLHEQALLETRLGHLIYGSIEVRENGDKKYIYVHFRENGLQITKYVGEYSEDLANVIIENNKVARELKKKLKDIKRELGLLQYATNDLTQEVKINIDLARRNMVESIYKQVKLEGVATTYADTEIIINGGKVYGMTQEDVSKVVNLKHAWEFILSEGVIAYPTNYSVLCQINAIVQEGFTYSAGRLRNVPVSIGGTSYIPTIPIESQVKEDLAELLSKENSYDVAIELLLYVMKKQLYIDGNKRTAVIFANHYLVSRGMGLIVIPAELVEEFKLHLINYYEGKSADIKKFLKDKCLTRLYEDNAN